MFWSSYWFKHRSFKTPWETYNPTPLWSVIDFQVLRVIRKTGRSPPTAGVIPSRSLDYSNKRENVSTYT
jgi:hypothetical protein